MKFAELYEVYEVSDRYIEELHSITENGSIYDALTWLGETRPYYGSILQDPLLAAWFKEYADSIAQFAVREIYNEEPLGIRYESSVIDHAGIDLPDRTLTWYIQNMMPDLVTKIERIAERDPGGAARAMTGLKQQHDIDVKRYMNPETIIRIVTDCIIRKDVAIGITALKKVLGTDAVSSLAYLNRHKTAVIKNILASMREADEWDTAVLADAVNNLLLLGFAWPELKILQKSLSAAKK